MLPGRKQTTAKSSVEYPLPPEIDSNHLPDSIDDLLEIAQTVAPGIPETYGATPLDKIKTMEQQANLLLDLQQHTYKIPDGVSLNIADYVHQTFRDRFYNRTNANDENYVTSLVKKEQYADNPRIMEMIERAEVGFASPAELLLVRSLLEIRSVELACLTHPYGEERIKMLDEMRGAVAESIEKMGGKYTPDSEPMYRVKDVILTDVTTADWAEVYGMSNQERLCAADQYGGVAGFLMIRKRQLGTMPDGTIIVERSSFVLQAHSESYVDPSQIEAMRGLASDNWEDDAVYVGDIGELSALLLETDEHTQAIPISSTIFAHNPHTAQLIREKEARLKQTKEIKGAKNGKEPTYQVTEPINLSSVEHNAALIAINSYDQNELLESLPRDSEDYEWVAHQLDILNTQPGRTVSFENNSILFVGREALESSEPEDD